jgi:polar amino acid transport system substrate-binding protein
MLKTSLLAITMVLNSANLNSAPVDQVKVSLSAEPSPPLATRSASGVWEGFEVELAVAVCRAGKIDCKIVATAWDGMISALKSKKIDVIWASMSITPERAQQISFTIPYYNAPAEFIGNKEDKFDFSPRGLKGKTVGVQASTTFANFVSRAYPDAVIKRYNTMDDATSDLAAGRIDLVMSDAIALDAFVRGESGRCCESKNIPRDAIFNGGIGAGIRKEDTELKAQFDAGIKSVYASGEFARIERKYFKYDVGAQSTN